MIFDKCKQLVDIQRSISLLESDSDVKNNSNIDGVRNALVTERSAVDR